MLIEFTIRNFMSYRDEVSLSMVASTTVKECESNDGYSNVSTMDNGKRYLRSAAIYGANGSGKSSVIAAMDISSLWCYGHLSMRASSSVSLFFIIVLMLKVQKSLFLCK